MSGISSSRAIYYLNNYNILMYVLYLGTPIK